MKYILEPIHNKYHQYYLIEYSFKKDINVISFYQKLNYKITYLNNKEYEYFDHIYTTKYSDYNDKDSLFYIFIG